MNTVKTLYLLLVCTAFFFSGCDEEPTLDGQYALSGNASGGEVAPPVEGPGTATLSGTFDPATRVLNYTVEWSALSSSPTAGGFYSGSSGSVVGTAWSFQPGSAGTGNISGNMTLTEVQATSILNDSWYYVITTIANPNGEVKGDVSLAK